MSLGHTHPAICTAKQSIGYSGVSPDSNLHKWNSISPSDNHDLCLSWKSQQITVLNSTFSCWNNLIFATQDILLGVIDMIILYQVFQMDFKNLKIIACINM